MKNARAKRNSKTPAQSENEKRRRWANMKKSCFLYAPATGHDNLVFDEEEKKNVYNT